MLNVILFIVFLVGVVLDIILAFILSDFFIEALDKYIKGSHK